MTMECLDKSPVVNVGQTFVTKFGNITLISVTDNGSGVIKVAPIDGSTPITRGTTDYTVESFYDGLITVKTNFFTLAGRGAHFWVCGYVDPGPTMCDQVFKLQDQNGNPLNGNVQLGTTALTVLGTGTISLEQGVSYTADASFSDQAVQTIAFTACTAEIIFTFTDKCEGVVCENVCTDLGHLVVRECDPFLGICQSVGTVKDSPLCEPVKPIGKEMVFPFSKDITAFWENDTVRSCVTKIVKALGGKFAYLEDGTKIVVVM